MPVLAVADTAIGFLGGIFSNPKDAERDAQTDRLKAAALAGDDASYWRLRCLSGDTSATTRQNAISFGVLSASDGACGYATDHAKGYAKAAVLEVDARRKVASTAGTVAAGAAQIGLNANPQVFTGTIGAAGVSVTPPWVWLAVGGVVLLVLWKRGK